MKKITLSIDGMTCSACSNGLEKYLAKQQGIKNVSVNLVLATANMEYDEIILDVAKIEEYVKEAGFKSLGEFKEIKVEEKDKKKKIYFVISTILAIIMMYISMGHMIKNSMLPIFNPEMYPVVYIFSLILLTTYFLVYGRDILKSGYKNMIHRTPNMDTLVSLGVITSFLYSLYNVYMYFYVGSNYLHQLYFESSAIVIYFVKLGRYIDGISKEKTKEAIKGLVEITPNTAILKINGKEKIVTLDEIKKGDILVCRPGEKIAVDGKVISGDTHLDESFITGESKPVAKKKGDTVLAGSLNYDGYIEYIAEKIGKESTVSEIVKLVVEATNTKMKISKVADKISGIFVPVIILIAIIIGSIYLILGKGTATAIIHFVTVLVAACPCSLGLATPLAVIVGQGICAKKGILIKKNEILELALKIDTVVMDKTGTLTYGKLKISNILNYSNMQNEEILQMVASIEEKSIHPIASAFKSYTDQNEIEKFKVENYEEITGKGLVASILGKEILIGNEKLFEERNIELQHKEDAKELILNGDTVIYVATDKVLACIIGLNDIVREGARDVISKLKESNIQVIMLTGDNIYTANNIAKSLNIQNVIAGVMPKDKVEEIKKLKQEGRHVLMCGDGINDSPSLRASDIGLSISSASDIAINSSDVILIKDNLQGILDLIEISKGIVKIIKQNLFWAFLYNILMIPIAAGVFGFVGVIITPMIASLAMVLSSITVILNTLRIKVRFK